MNSEKQSLGASSSFMLNPNRRREMNSEQLEKSLGASSSFVVKPNRRRVINFRMMWKWAYRRVREKLRDRRGVFKIERLTEMKSLFLDARGEDKDLGPEEFVDAFQHHDALKVEGKESMSRYNLDQFFLDIDVDCSGGVSWDEFTSYMISTVVANDNERGMEFIPNAPPLETAHEHKDQVRRLVLNGPEGLILTAGFDGMLKAWDSTGRHVRTINNAKYSVARATQKPGFGTDVCPVTDVVIGSHGTVTYVTGVDKSLHLYDSKTLNLLRRYIGRDKYNDLSIPAEFIGGSKAPVETAVLMELNDAVMTLEVATTNEKEHAFLGLSDGRLAAYPIMRHSSVSQIRPSYITQVHTGSFSKIRQLCPDQLLSCGWDTELCLTSMSTGQVISRLGGGGISNEGHNKAAFDFAFNRNTNILASVSNEREIYLWNPQTESPITKLEGHSALLTSVCFNEQQNQLISLGADNCLKIWDMRNYKVFQSIKHCDRYSRLKHVAYDDENHCIVGAANVPYTWSMRQSMSHFSTAHHGHTENIVGLGVVESKNYLITADAHSLMVWDLDSGRRTRVFPIDSDSGLPVATLTLDFLNRRVGCVNHSGMMSIYNFTNGQCVKEFSAKTADPPIKMLHLQDSSGEEKVFAIIAPSELLLTVEPSESHPEIRYRHLPAKKGLFSAALVLGTGDVGTLPMLLLGTSEGRLLIVSPNTASVMATMSHPKEKKTHDPARRQTDGDVLDEIFKGANTKPKMAVEGISYLQKQRLYVTILGGKHIFFWDLRRKNQIVLVYDTFITPAEAQLCLETDPTSKYVITADEVGFVYVRDVGQMPENVPGAHYERSQVVLKWVFRAHQGAVQRLLTIPHKRPFLVTQGVDCFVKCYSYSGELVGYYGQSAEWFFDHRVSWEAEGGRAELGVEKMPRESVAAFNMQTNLKTAPIGDGLQTLGKTVGFADDTFFTSVTPASQTPADTPQEAPFSSPPGVGLPAAILEEEATQSVIEEESNETTKPMEKPPVPKFSLRKEIPNIGPGDISYDKIHTTQAGGSNYHDLRHPIRSLTPSTKSTSKARGAVLRQERAYSQQRSVSNARSGSLSATNPLVDPHDENTAEPSTRLPERKRWESPPGKKEQGAMRDLASIMTEVPYNATDVDSKVTGSAFRVTTRGSDGKNVHPSTAPTSTGHLEGSFGCGATNPLSGGGLPPLGGRSHTPEVSRVGLFKSTRGPIKRSLTPSLGIRDVGRSVSSSASTPTPKQSKLTSLFQEAMEQGPPTILAAGGGAPFNPLGSPVTPSLNRSGEVAPASELGGFLHKSVEVPDSEMDEHYGDEDMENLSDTEEGSLNGSGRQSSPRKASPKTSPIDPKPGSPKVQELQSATSPKPQQKPPHAHDARNHAVDSTRERIRAAQKQDSSSWTSRAYSLLPVNELPHTAELQRATTTQPGQRRQPIAISSLSKVQRRPPGGWTGVERVNTPLGGGAKAGFSNTQPLPSLKKM